MKRLRKLKEIELENKICINNFWSLLGVCNKNLIFLFLKHMLWVLKRTISMKRFFWAPKTYVKIDG